MNWKKDKLKPSQPYFVFDTKDFRQKIYLQHGISHFYSYQLEEKNCIRVVPDGWIEELAQAKDFSKRIEIFLTAYYNAEKKKEKPYGKKELVLSVKQMVYESDGRIKISQLQENTGYTQRYINKVFIEGMGFSPKTFCKIIQFQRALEFLNYGAPGNMTEAAVDLGYYDQPQFIFP